jgi:hypothetical protein
VLLVVESKCMESAAGDPGIGSGFTVALWLPACGAPDRLVQALSGRGIGVWPVTSPYAALAAACMASRTARAARGNIAGSMALVIVNPEQQPDAKGVFEAVAKFAPGVRCWMFGPATNPKLRAIVETDVDGWPGSVATKGPEIVVRPRPVDEAEGKPMPVRPRPGPSRPDYRTSSVGKPGLRLAGEGSLDPTPERVDVDKNRSESVGEGFAAPPRGQVLTPEELRMLLGDDGPDVQGQR